MSNTNFGFEATPTCGFGGMEVPVGGSGLANSNKDNGNHYGQYRPGHGKPGHGRPGFGGRK